MTKEQIKKHKEVFKYICICLHAIKSQLPFEKISFIFEKLNGMNPNKELSKVHEDILNGLEESCTNDLQEFEKDYKNYIKFHKE